jgi:hypothetical protein
MSRARERQAKKQKAGVVAEIVAGECDKI